MLGKIASYFKKKPKVSAYDLKAEEVSLFYSEQYGHEKMPKDHRKRVKKIRKQFEKEIVGLKPAEQEALAIEYMQYEMDYLLCLLGKKSWAEL